MGNAIASMFEYVVAQVNSLTWTYAAIPAIALVGLYFTFKLKFIQFRWLPEMFRLLGEGISKDGADRKKSISSFQAFCISTAARVGTGNMAGVAIAITIGGVGSIFWMWLMAMIGAATAYAEATLAQVFKVRGKNSFIGGPAYYMERGLGLRWMGVLFAILLILTYGITFNTVQSNTIATAFNYSFGIEYYVVGIVLALLSALVFFGGAHRVASISEIVVPVMAILYIMVTVYVMVIHFTEIPSVFAAIFKNAFGIEQVGGGVLGAAIMMGVRRGLFSNEAGVGSAPNASASATVSHPAKQGFIQALGVFTDTLIICSCTVFIIMLSGVPLDGVVTGIALNQLAFDSQFGQYGNIFIAIAILLFAFTSILGNYYYGEMNILFITKNPKVLLIYRLVVVISIFWGAIATLAVVWELADVTMALMALCNIIALILLRKVIIKVSNNYTSKRRNGDRNPQFQASELPEFEDKIKDIWN